MSCGIYDRDSLCHNNICALTALSLSPNAIEVRSRARARDSRRRNLKNSQLHIGQTAECVRLQLEPHL